MVGKIPHGFGDFHRIRTGPAKNRDHHGRSGLRIPAHPKTHVDAFVLNLCLALATSFRYTGEPLALPNDQIGCIRPQWLTALAAEAENCDAVRRTGLRRYRRFRS